MKLGKVALVRNIKLVKTMKFYDVCLLDEEIWGKPF
jgi:hypothetical protein